MAKVRLSMTLKLFKKGKMILCITKRVKGRILYAAQVKSWDKAYFKVIYDRQKGYYNDAWCKDMDDLKFFVSGFTEKSLIKFLGGGKDG